MAAPKGKKTLDILFDEIIIDISENGKSAISALQGRMSTQTFYALLKDDEKSKRYARATEMRADRMAEDIINIADSVGDDLITLPDGRELENQKVISRDKLRVDSRKWLLAKLHPKKYGDKMDVTTDGNPIQQLPPVIIKTKK